MPGTIQVSVLEIVGLQSSPPISLVSIKAVAVGKKEYETSVIEDFSFPLTSLRDNLIIKFLDAERKKISQTGVETKLIVEKGLWDDTFPLEGGGHVHLKLRFLLSAEERDQVRAMRHTALRKKQGGIMISNLTSPDIAIDDETSDSQKSILQSEAAVTVRPTVLGKISDKNPKSVIIKDVEEKPCSVQKLMDTISKDTKKESSSTSTTTAEKFPPINVVARAGSGSSKVLDMSKPNEKKESSSPSTTSVEKLYNQMPPINVVARVGLGSSKSLDTSKPNEKPSPLGKSPSAVRNMISVFESNPVENVKKPRIKPPPTKLKAFEDTVKTELRVLETTATNDSKVVRKESYMNEDNLFAEDLIRACTMPTDLKNELTVVQKGNYVNEENISAEDLIRACTSETASVSGRITDEHLSRDDDNPQNCSDESDDLVRNEKEAHPKELHEVNSQGVLHDESRRKERLEDKNDGLVLKELHEVNIHGVLLDESKSEECREDKNDDLVLKELHEVNIHGVLLDESKSEECREDKNDGLVRNEEETHLNELHEVNSQVVLLDESKSEECREDKNDGLVKNEEEIRLKESHEVYSQGVLLDESRPEECWEDKNDGLEYSGGWIFTDNSTCLCITTGGKQTMHVIGSCCAEIITSPKPGSEEEVNKNEENSPPENPAADEARRGPFRKVVRIAIMVGFAALVFFTRQRRTR